MGHLVVIKGVPDFREGKVRFKPDNTLDRTSTPTVLNPNDRLAIEAALQAKVKYGGKVTVISMGPPEYKRILREAMEIYADELVLLSDVKMAGADTLATAETLATAIRKMGSYNLIFAGFKTADGETGQTGPQTAWKLGLPLVTHIVHFELDTSSRMVLAQRIAYDEIEEIESPYPALLVTDPGFRTTYRTARERLLLSHLTDDTKERAKDFEKFLTIWNAEKLGVNQNKIGLKGSPTIVRKVEPIPIPPSQRKAKIIDGNQSEELRELAKLIVHKTSS